MRQWHKIGLNISLYTGRLIELNSYADKVLIMLQELTCSRVAGVSSQPSPAYLYSEGAPV
ncbi:hypothetical protein [uncultured Lactobacillus sp.]|uniref:hypothetical protein n=1 Tax=uncultured Lactobacillus sp. TaxID=153152 RepID=UPI0026007499|nr:hypothetical protein [uncultured Lactobacillus sp.]